MKFGNLVAAKWGGNDKLQHSEIRKIAEYLEIEISEEKIKRIAQKLYGGTSTFKKERLVCAKRALPESKKLKPKRCLEKL